MVAYSFKARFAEPILAGTKRQTLRNDRKRHAREGEELQLYTGMRTKHCKLVGRATCILVEPIRIHIEGGIVEFFDGREPLTMLADVQAFAVADGFEHWRALAAFWNKTHPGLLEWTGVRVGWGETLRLGT